jgi:hypothetical protein
MTAALSAEFGYFPEALEIVSGPITLSSRPDLAQTVANMATWPLAEGDWVFAPPGERVFALPVTHRIAHEAADGPAHLDFLVWALSFFSGMRLSATEAGFVDGTPLKPQALVDFGSISRPQWVRALALAEAYWQANRASPAAVAQWTAAVHCLFLAQYRRALQYERFLYLYLALDACFALQKAASASKPPRLHSERIDWMCAEFGTPAPVWSVEVAKLRNATIHEGLYMGRPLGFALHDRKSAENLPLEMGNLICRFLVALIGAPGSAYVRQPISTYQAQGLDL